MKKNKRLLILVGILLVFGGFTFAYFVGRMLTEGSGATTTVTTAELKNSKVTVTGTLNFDYDGMLPGHKDVSAITVTATGNNELIPYNLVWKGSNNLNTDLNFTVYKVSETIDVEANCNQIKKTVNGGIMMYEECEISNITSLGEAISEGTIPKNSTGTTVTLAPNEFITSTSTGATAYYYVLLEYPNLNENQNLDMGQGFEGEVTVEPSNIEPDINILAVNVYNEETGKYEESKSIPEGNYTLSEKSTCNNEAVPIWDNKKGLLVTNLTQSGTECYLFFELTQSNKTLANIGITETDGEVDSFTGPSCNNNSNCGTTNMNQNGIYEAEDDFGKSYYYRGTVDNNWVVFGKDTTSNENIWWRIIRINGNGTIRLIYASTTNSIPGTQGEKTMIKPKQYAGRSEYPRAVKFNEKYNDNKYVGYMYNSSPETSTSLEEAHKVTKDSTNSTILEQIKLWYEEDTNLKDLSKKIDVDTGFCSDTTISTTNHGSYYPGTGQGFGTQYTAYAGADRVWQSNSTSWNSTEQTPTLKCGKDDASRKRDLYTGPGANVNGTKGSNGTTITGNDVLPIPVGLITMDEVIYAGGFAGQANNGYWLYTNQYYWTMSPFSMYSSGYAQVFYVYDNGNLSGNGVNLNIYGVRPVINLKSTVKITTNGEGDPGTTTNPYIVVTE